MKAWKAVTLTEEDSFLWCQLLTSEVIYYVYYYANIRQQTYGRGKELDIIKSEYFGLSVVCNFFIAHLQVANANYHLCTLLFILRAIDTSVKYISI